MLVCSSVNDTSGKDQRDCSARRPARRFVRSSVRKQVVNIPSFLVRLDSQKHIDFALRSPLSSGGRPGRVKRKNMRKGEKGADKDEEADED